MWHLYLNKNNIYIVWWIKSCVDILALFDFDLLQSQVVQCVSPVVQLSSEVSEWVRSTDAADFPSRLTYGSGVNNSLSLLYFLSKIKHSRHCRILGDTWMEQFILWLKWDTTDCRITTYLILWNTNNGRNIFKFHYYCCCNDLCCISLLKVWALSVSLFVSCCDDVLVK